MAEKKLHKITPLNPEVMDSPYSGKPIYPSFDIKETDLPDIKDKKIDDEFEVRIKVKVKGINKGRAGDIRVETEMLEIGLSGK